MDFRVEVSLWNMYGSHNGQAPAQLNVASDFSDKLGLKTQSQTQEQHHQEQPQEAGKQADEHEPRAADAPLAEAALVPSVATVNVAQAMLIQQHQLAQLPGVAELYPLGMQAGQHLSHLPYGFLQSAEQTDQLYDAMAAQQNAPTVTHDPVFQQTAAQAESRADAFARNTSLLARNTDVGETSSVEQLNRYLAQRWPQRSSLLLPRGNGVELLIRDYHLTPEEQDSLVTDLLLRMRSQNTPPQQIWINGQSVWQLAPPMSIQGEK
jgi:hypothetical protein